MNSVLGRISSKNATEYLYAALKRDKLAFFGSSFFLQKLPYQFEWIIIFEFFWISLLIDESRNPENISSSGNKKM